MPSGSLLNLDNLSISAWVVLTTYELLASFNWSTAACLTTKDPKSWNLKEIENVELDCTFCDSAVLHTALCWEPIAIYSAIVTVSLVEVPANVVLTVRVAPLYAPLA